MHWSTSVHWWIYCCRKMTLFHSIRFIFVHSINVIGTELGWALPQITQFSWTQLKWCRRKPSRCHNNINDMAVCITHYTSRLSFRSVPRLMNDQEWPINLHRRCLNSINGTYGYMLDQLANNEQQWLLNPLLMRYTRAEDC